MTPERYRQIAQIAADALDTSLHLDARSRAAYIAEACAGDPDLLAEVESLLAADHAGISLEPGVPARVGVYRVVREIGRGGMGWVYLAERDDGQFEQRAAIKILQRGIDPSGVSRFFAERQILARLDHPNIARLFDGGMTPDGRPYFVMEYLDAEPVTIYCRRHALSIGERIKLFLSVCEAVEYAHRRLVLHRDIKPANILVDASGVPKLLDFGIAKALEPDGEAQLTELGSRAMTLQYASPEQLRGEPLSTASDVYALGLLLYELTAESPPYRVPSGAVAEQVRLICEEQPKPASEIAPPAVARRIRGDLDRVILKAIEKDPALRYGSAANLAEDLRRFLENRPVAARPANALYRARKYATRHWRALLAAGAAGIVLFVAITSALIEGRRAESNFQDVRRLANSFLFEFHDAIANLPGSTPARELVERRAVEYLDILSKKSPNDIDLQRELAESYIRIGMAQGDNYQSNLGKAKEAVSSLEKAVTLLTQVYRARTSDPDVRAELARAKIALAAAIGPSDLARNNQLRAEALELLNDKSSPKLAARAKLAMGQAYFGNAERLADKGRIQEALDARNKSIEVLGELAASDPGYDDAQRLLAQSLKRRAALYVSKLHEPGKARQDLDLAIRIDDQRIARDPGNGAARLDRALGQSYLSVVLRQQGDFAGSEDMINRAIATRVEFLRAGPRDIRNRTWLMGDYVKLSALRRAQHRWDDSLAAIQQGLDVGNQADDQAKRSKELISFNAELHAESAQTHAGLGDCRDAREELDKASRLGSDGGSATSAAAKDAVANCGKK